MAYISTNPPVKDISLLSVQGSLHRLYRDATFLMALNGEVQVQVSGHPSYLNHYALMLVEPDTTFDITGHGSNLLMLVRMDYDFFMQGPAGRFGQIVCNSAEDSQRDYSLLRQMFSHLAMTYFERSDCRELRLLELCYSILYYLNTLHFIAGGPSLSDSQNHELRARQIISYIESNYMHDIRLDDLSEATFLSPSYLSRLFKKIIGTNFKSYLETVRLRHAVEDMRNTSQTITTIAYNNGFPNVSALSSAIRKTYEMSPNEFRRSLSAVPPDAAPPEEFEAVEYDNVRESLEILAGPEPAKALGMFRYPDQTEYIIDDVSQFRPITPIWKAMINIGSLLGLNNVNIKSQLHLLQDEIGFHYARIETVLAEDAMPSLPDGGYNFSYFDRAIELLQSLKLTPFLDLSFKNENTLIPRSSPLYRGDKPRQHPSGRQFNQKVSALMRHCINTFGAGEVERWGVEVCAVHDENLEYEETPEEYVRRFQDVFSMIKSWLPRMLVGGPEQNIIQDNDFILTVAGLLHSRGITPDFFSLCAVPYEPTRSEGAAAPFIPSPRPDYIRDRVKGIRDALHTLLPQPVPLWITMLSPDIRIRNHVNDTCYQATFIAKTTIDLVDLVDVIGYWQFSDVDTEYIDTTRILFGGTGILSKDGLKKPGFTVLKRLSNVNTLLIRKQPNLLVATNAINTYNIVLCNYAHFTDLYCLTSGEDVTCDNVYSVFGDAATRDINLTLHGLLPGRYKAITTTLNRENGSLFDEWMRYGIQDGLQPHDIRYLQDIVHPQRIVRYHDCTDGTLTLSTQMLPHEVKFLLLLREL